MHVISSYFFNKFNAILHSGLPSWKLEVSIRKLGEVLGKW